MKTYYGNPDDYGDNEPLFMGELASRKTPWGKATESYRLCDGLFFYRTDHHDCWHVSPYLQERMPYRLYDGCWYSHLLWFLIVLSFPSFFHDGVVEAAHTAYNAVEDAASEVMTGRIRA